MRQIRDVGNYSRVHYCSILDAAMGGICDLSFAVILVLFLTEGTSSNEDLAEEVDLFKAVGLGDKAFAGVTKTTGQNDRSAAYRFTTSTKDLIASQQAFEQANKMIHNSHDFIVSAYVKLNPTRKYDNPVVSISSQGGHDLFFKFVVSDKSGGAGLQITVALQDKGGRTLTFKGSKSSLDNTKWHKVAVRVQDTQSMLRIFIDDEMVSVYPFKYQIAPYPQNAELRLAQIYEVYLENTGIITFRFKGDLQDVKFSLGQALNDCPATAKSTMILNLNREKIKCKCSDVVGTKDCVMDGFRYEDGNRWTKDKCTLCQCKWGQVICTHICQVCKDSGQTYLHGETWKSGNDSCHTCKCEEGNTTCSPPSCPTPRCSQNSGGLITPKGQCCPICKEEHCARIGKVYKKCSCDATCSSQGSKCQPCTEGCFCPKGKVLDKNGKCVATSKCNCIYKGKEYSPLESYIKPCSYCFCISGEMRCHNFC